MKVQNQKTILATDRTVVQSKGERQIADWLSTHKIAYRYDDKFQIIQGFATRPDFYLPQHDLYIEYWGMDTTDYKIGMLLKQKLYQQEGKSSSRSSRRTCLISTGNSWHPCGRRKTEYDPS